MTLRTSSPHAKGRWAALLVVLAALLLVAAQALLAFVDGSTFEGNDGNLVVDTSGKTDWANVADLRIGYDLPSGTGDNAFGQGTKEDDANVTTVSGSIPPNKNDLIRFYVASENVGTNTLLYLAWERAVNIGNANLDFEFNQNATANLGVVGKHTIIRTPGDLLVTYDFGGSGFPTLGLNFWLTSANDSASDCFNAHALPCWGKHLALNSGNSEGAVNTVVVTDPLGTPSPRDLPIGTFGEASINLTGAGVFVPGTCGSFGSAFLKSRSSSSFTAEIKDFIAPIAAHVTNCGSITINKITENGDGTFGYTTTGGLDPSTFDLMNGESQAYTDEVLPGNYSVTESTLPANWSLDNLECDVTGTGTSATPSGAVANITIASGGTVDCTYTNVHTLESPGIGTTLSDAEIAIGDSIHDSAALTGSFTADAGGTVTYTVYTDSACSSPAVDGTDIDAQPSTASVTAGVIDDSDAVQFLHAGDFYWQAVYSGDGNNNGATSVCTDEHLVVDLNSPDISTAQSLIPDDSATISGATDDAGGVIDFYLFAPGDTCDTDHLGDAAFHEQVSVDGNDTYYTSNAGADVPVVADEEGTWTWLVIYGGDDNNDPTSSDCVETFTISNS